MDRPPLDTTRLRELLGETWRSVEVVDETSSTNSDLLDAATSGAPDRSLLVAEHQVSGRGRFERVWTSPPRAGLTFSVLIRPAVPVSSWGWLPLFAGVALAQAVTAQTPVPVALKWPNDLLAVATGGKLAGILAQSAGDAVVIGIGLNVTTTRAELPVDTATSLALAGGSSGEAALDRVALLAAVAAALDDWIGRWTDAGGAADDCGLAAAYRDRCATLGRHVRVSLGEGAVLDGVALDIDPHGALVLETDTGMQTVVAGDVEHLRQR